jgi:hypothetical protein
VNFGGGTQGGKADPKSYGTPGEESASKRFMHSKMNGTEMDWHQMTGEKGTGVLDRTNPFGSGPGESGLLDRNNPFAHSSAANPYEAPPGQPFQAEIGAPRVNTPTMPGLMQQKQMGLSDEKSKARIQDLESELQQTYAALGGSDESDLNNLHAKTRNLEYGTKVDYPTAPASDDADRLAAAYRPASSSSYEYRDANAPGAQPGRQSGPMADELKGLPGVVKPGADGMDRVDTQRLTLNNASALGSQQRELDRLNAELDALRGKTAAGGDAALQAGLGNY